jgi:hypothetical protein
MKPGWGPILAIVSPFAGAAWPLFDDAIVNYVGLSWTELGVRNVRVRSQSFVG